MPGNKKTNVVKNPKEMSTPFTMWLPVWMKEELIAISKKTSTPMAQLAVTAIREKYFKGRK